MGEFKMPSLGADMEKGTLVAWNVKAGDAVKHGDIIAVVETEKGAFETECYEDGVIDRLFVEPGSTVPVGTTLALVRVAGAEAPRAPVMPVQPAEPAPVPVPVPAAAAAPPVVEPTAPPPVEPAMEPAHSPEEGAAWVAVSPLARRIAAQLGVDLSTVHGTGPGDAIRREDVEQAAEALRAPIHAAVPVVVSAAVAEVPLVHGSAGVSVRSEEELHAGMRRAIAAAMSRSNREIPHYYLSTRIDMSESLRWLAEENQRRPIQDRLLAAVLSLRAVALALRKVPELNGFWTGDAYRPGDGIHIGFAVALRRGGLVTPAIHDADRKGLDEMQAALNDVIKRARGGRLRASEMSDPTITVTNLGELGAESVLGVIYPPQVALVGFGRITDQPWAVGGMLGVRPVLTASLAGDHRATDGHRGAQFLDALGRLLQEPEKL